MRCGTIPGALLLLLSGGIGAAGQDDPKALDFFETRVRPVLVDECYACHSAGAKKAKGGLRLDTRDSLLRGGERGPAIVPGDPAKSLLVRALRHQEDDLQMPPRGKLSEAQIAAFETWVKNGAIDPRAVGSPTTGATADAAVRHWSFQPVRTPRRPDVRRTEWPANPVDDFILARLEEKGLSPSPPADKRTLLRRVSFDLTGLPPAPEELEAFLADPRHDAFEKVVDRLLASPRYGERWGRHWLDVARYADTRAEVILHARDYPHAFRYRDWVIRAFNDDLPYDEFLIQQIAADRLGGTPDRLAALGFLTLGKSTPEPFDVLYEFIDDCIDTVSRATMGLSVSCARCHDHKYDPIPTDDYYSLYGIFGSSKEVESLLVPEKSEIVVAHREELRKREEELAAFRKARRSELAGRFRTPEKIAQYLLAAHRTRGMSEAQTVAWARARGLQPKMVARWRAFLDTRKNKSGAALRAWHAFSELPERCFREKAEALAMSWKGVNPIVDQAFRDDVPGSLADVAERYGVLLARFDRSSPLSDPAQEALRQVLHGSGSPVRIADPELKDFLHPEDGEALARLEKGLSEQKDLGVTLVPRAHAIEDAPVPLKPRVFVRGKPGNPGKEVPRRFLELLSGGPRVPFEDGSGRLELARAIASRANPLTARVMANRVWMHHFGEGLVRTPSDFGTRGEPPSHPELLDYLADRFMADAASAPLGMNWSIKSLHRLLLLSSTYRQSSQDRRESREIDPDNRLFWRMNPRKLEIEALRDALLFVSDSLDETRAGRPVDLGDPSNRRRTVYGMIDRVHLAGVLRIFDFADPETHSPRRYSSTVPQQALFLMNSSFVLDRARRLANRRDVAGEAEPERRIRRLYTLAFQRDPSPAETALGLDFVRTTAAARLSAWEKYAHALILLNEFAFVD